MSIIHTFDNETEEIIKASHFAPEIDGFPETVIVTFSSKNLDMFLNSNTVEKIMEFNDDESGNKTIYKTSCNNKEIAYCKSPVGGPASALLLEKLISLGGRRFLFYGSCGTLVKEIDPGCLIVPTSAYRDEGTSYHYAPPSDYIDIVTSDKLIEILDELNQPHVQTKTWTTDAFYRETRRNMQLRKDEGCLVVEMECASLAAVCQLRKVDFYQFLYSEDNLDDEEYDKRIMGKVPHSETERYLLVAQEVAARI